MFGGGLTAKTIPSEPAHRSGQDWEQKGTEGEMYSEDLDCTDFLSKECVRNFKPPPQPENMRKDSQRTREAPLFRS